MALNREEAMREALQRLYTLVKVAKPAAEAIGGLLDAAQAEGDVSSRLNLLYVRHQAEQASSQAEQAARNLNNIAEQLGIEFEGGNDDSSDIQS